MSPVALADWRPGASLEHLKKRAQIFADLRAFFASRGVMEVDTPLVSAASATDPYLTSMCVTTGRQELYLQTSPEFAMKRLLAAGSGPIYQLGKCFRADETGDKHNPEFTMLEWYRPGFSLQQLKQEAIALLVAILGPLDVVETDYHSCFESSLGIDPHGASQAQLRVCAIDAGLSPDIDEWSRDELIDLLFSHCVEPSMAKDCIHVISDFPAHTAALARLRTDATGRPVADRFEVYINGMELANAFHELLDATELRSRMNRDNEARSRLGKPSIPLDERLLAAMTAGLPPCSGIALGVDRLVMLALGVDRIDQALPFSHQRVDASV